MKTIIDISGALLDEAKRIAAREGVTVRELVERGLRLALEDRRRHRPFRLRKASFRGKGMAVALRGASWEKIRELAYEGRGA